MTSFRIKEIREKKGMTQEELVKKSGVSRGTISALENQEQKSSNSSTLVKLAEALEVKIKDLF